jgi:nucleotide-binding universal stress UspA family protein
LQNTTGTHARVWVTGGEAARAIAAAARHSHADLVVIGKSGSFWRPSMHRTTPYEIVREAPCPVVIC